MAQPSDKEANLHIFVNRRKFERSDGVKERMTPAEIAKLVDVPADNAVVRFDSGPNKGQEVTQEVDIQNGEHFLVTRRVVEGGNERRAD